MSDGFLTVRILLGASDRLMAQASQFPVFPVAIVLSRVTLVLAGTAWMDIRPLLGAATPVAPMALVEPIVRVLLPLVICLVLWLTKRAELPMRMKPYLIVCFFLALGASHYLYTCVTGFVF